MDNGVYSIVKSDHGTKCVFVDQDVAECRYLNQKANANRCRQDHEQAERAAEFEAIRTRVKEKERKSAIQKYRMDRAIFRIVVQELMLFLVGVVVYAGFQHGHVSVDFAAPVTILVLVIACIKMGWLFSYFRKR